MNIKIDSRKVKKGDIFVAIGNGHNYIVDAFRNGASKVIIEKGKVGHNIIKVRDTRVYLANYLKEKYYNKINDLKLIGVTGTNGKTTTAYLIYEALNKAKIKCAYIGTIGFYLNDKVRDLENTTPEILDIYEMLLEAIENNVKFVVMEVSSHALSTNRVLGLEFDYAIFTNLTEEHLDYHKNMHNYFKCKKKLFKQIKEDGLGIINIDDNYGKRIKLKNKITISKIKGNYILNDYSLDDKTKFILNNKKYETKLKGLYNIYNMINVIVLLDELGIKNKYKIIKNLDIAPGRMEIINYKKSFVIIDYAHTPDAVLNVIKAVKDFAKSKIYVIIGCGGNRDKFKRPIMAKIASENSDLVILTSDNPRDEDAIDIINDMIKGIDKDNYQIVVNRKDAIRKGMQLLENDDILLVLGKGHEKYQIIGKEKIFFDDKIEIKKCIRR